MYNLHFIYFYEHKSKGTAAYMMRSLPFSPLSDI